LESDIELRRGSITFHFNRLTGVVWANVRSPVFVLRKHKILLSNKIIQLNIWYEWNYYSILEVLVANGKGA